MRRSIASLLVKVYPPKWREEYGPELAGVLAERPIGRRDMADVVWNGVVRRLREDEPWKLVGTPMLLAFSSALILNILTPAPYAADMFGGSRMGQLVYVWVGYWTVLRAEDGSNRGGSAAVKMSLWITWPMTVIGLLAAVDVLPLFFIAPGDPVPGGIGLHYYHSSRWTPTPVLLAAAPLLNVPFVWIMGATGGLLGRLVIRRRLHQPTH